MSSSARHAPRQPTRPAARAVLVLAVVTALTAAGSASYTVKGGDTLWDLARRFGVSVPQLAAHNGISDVGYIRSGSVLRVPGSATGPVSGATGSAPTATAGSAYIVRAGDTLLEISISTGVLMRDIAAANRLGSYDHIYVGQQLTIPAGTATASSSSSVAEATTTTSRSRTASRADVERILERVAADYGFSPRFIKAIAMMESGWNNSVVSPAGAVGIMQVLPSTGEFVSKYLVGRSLDLRDPTDNVTAGVAYIAHLWRLTGGNVDRTLAGYYQGLGSVTRHGVFPSTKQYVRTILALRDRY